MEPDSATAGRGRGCNPIEENDGVEYNIDDGADVYGCDCYEVPCLSIATLRCGSTPVHFPFPFSCSFPCYSSPMNENEDKNPSSSSGLRGKDIA